MTFLSLAPVFPELLLAIGALVLLLVGAFGGDRSASGITDFSVAMLAGVAVIAGASSFAVSDTLTAFGGGYLADSLAGVFKILVLLSASVALLMARGWMQQAGSFRPEYPVLVMLSVLGMMVMLSAGNLLVLYIGLELQSLVLYVLAAFRRDNSRSSEAALKYFVLGGLASGFLLYGISLVYGATGSIAFSDVPVSGHVPLTGMAFILAALLFKISAVPFHMWAPDVYEGAPTPVTAFFSVAPKLAAFGLLLRLLYGPFAGLMAEWQDILMVVSAATMLVGSLAAIGQTNIKRLMAYSSVGHVGFALMGMASGTETGLTAVILYLVFYIVMSLGAFSVILLMQRDGEALENISDLSGVARVHPGLAAAMAMLMFSMAGIPPLVGFFTKLSIFMAVLNSGLVWLAIVGAVASVIGAFYYLRIIKVMYFDEPEGGFDLPLDPSLAMTAVATSVLTLAGVGLLGNLVSVAHYALHVLPLAP